MKFITEDDLRDLYKIEPFTDYQIEPGSRITPGARQFLADRGINMFDDTSSWKNRKTVIEKDPSPLSERKKKLNKKRVYSKIKTMEALFLVAAEELLNVDVLLAQKIINLTKIFSDIKNAVDGKSLSDQICCQKCTGIYEENFSDYLDDCFEITEYHIQLAKGKEIIALHRLRCALREFDLDVLEFLNSSNDENKQCKEVIGKVNQITNTLSQLICTTVGGERCQKK